MGVLWRCSPLVPFEDASAIARLNNLYISTAKTTNNPTKNCAEDLSRLTDIENKLMITIKDRERRWGKIGVGN